MVCDDSSALRSKEPAEVIFARQAAFDEAC
jgi:hypothetical protein